MICPNMRQLTVHSPYCSVVHQDVRLSLIHIYVEQLVREAGKILPGVPIWIGGPEVSYDSPTVLQRLPEVFGVMKGEGEETFRELVHYYMEGGSLEKIDGITYRGEKGQILENPWRPVMDLSKVCLLYTSRCV